MSDAERRRDRGAFSRSDHGTLNHILLDDHIWLARFEEREVLSTGLDAKLYGDFTDLRTARRAENAQIEAFAAGMRLGALTGLIRYVNNEGPTSEDPLKLLLFHFFYYQNHHRGQAHDLLCQAAHCGLVLDMHRVIHSYGHKAAYFPLAYPRLGG